MLSIPEDIIEGVITHLHWHHDRDTLMSCAVVSHSFFPASRKKLFFSVHLDHPQKPQKLHDLLNIEPDIAPIIRELYVEDFHEEVWCATNEYLPQLLMTMFRLELLSIAVPESNPLTAWNHLSGDLQSAVEERLRSHILSEIRVETLDLPLSIIGQFTHLRKFVLNDADFYDDSPGQSSHVPTGTDPHLEALEVCRLSEPLPAAMSLLTGKLQHLYIGSSDPSTLAAMKDVIRSSGTTIRSIAWSYSSLSIAATVQLGLIQNLQFLLFAISGMVQGDERYFNPDLISVMSRLEDGAATAALKDLTIFFTVRRYRNYEQAIECLTHREEWNRLDSLLLERSPALQRLHICIEVHDIEWPDDDSDLQTRMRLQLPRLAERGVLVAERRMRQELLDRAWSRSRFE